MFRTLTLFVLLLLLIFAGAPKNYVASADGSEEFVPGEVVVKLYKSSDLPTLAATTHQSFR